MIRAAEPTERAAVVTVAPQATRPLPAQARRRSRLRRIAEHWPQYAAISPFFTVFLVFGLAPVIFSLYLAFHEWDGLGSMHYVGLEQFRRLADDPLFWQSLRNTLVIWAMSTVPTLAIALVLASLINSAKRLTSFYRVAVFVPNITSIVAMAILFGALFSTNFGLVNALLHSLGLGRVHWLTSPWGMKVVIASLITWQWTGYNAIIYLAGLQAIPTELYEAAKVDGAGPIRSFFSITVPLLRPVILFTVVVSTVTGMQTFTEPQVLFDAQLPPNMGGSGQGGLTMVLYFYHQTFDNNRYGYGAAIAWSVFLVVIVFVLINWRLLARGERAAGR